MRDVSNLVMFSDVDLRVEHERYLNLTVAVTTQRVTFAWLKESVFSYL